MRKVHNAPPNFTRDNSQFRELDGSRFHVLLIILPLSAVAFSFGVRHDGWC